MARINGNDAPNTLNGTAENDVIRGAGGADTISGSAGDDLLNGAGGSRLLESYINTGLGNKFTANGGGWRSDIYPRYLADVNGDGLADLIGFGEGAVEVALSKGNGTFAAPKEVITDTFTRADGGWMDNNSVPRLMGDVNGDGMADILGIGYGGSVVALAKGDGTFAVAKDTGLGEAFTANGGGWRSDIYPRYLADVNGDGRADLVGFGEGSVEVALSKGNGTFAAPKVAISDTFTRSKGGWMDNNSVPRLMGDINGDGMADILGIGYGGSGVYFAKGDGTFAPSGIATGLGSSFTANDGGWRSDLYPRYLADVNGDGRADLVGFGNGAVGVALSKGDGSFERPKDLITNNFTRSDGGWMDNNSVPRLMGDINGDGMADILGIGYGGSTTWLAPDDIADDVLNGGDGNDVLIGGQGVNSLTGGAGVDRFVLTQPMQNSVARQVIEDFEKGIDKLDFKGAIQDLRFQRRGNDTVIKLDEAEIAIVKNTVIDSRDFLQTKGPALTPDQINDISALVEAWAQRYADTVGDTVGEVNLSNVKFTQGDIVYEQKPVISVGEPKTASITFRNSSPTNQSAQVTFGADTNWQTSAAVATAWKVGGKLTTKAGYKVITKVTTPVEGSIEKSGEISVEINGEYGKTETRTNVTGGRSFDQTSFTTNTPANSVTTADITYNRQSFDSKFTIPVDITGTVKIDLQRGDDYDIVDLPIGAILQYYNPSQFASVDRNNLTYSVLPNGDYLAYSPTTRATVKGEAKGVVNVVGRQTVSTVIDHNLTNPASAPAAGYRGNQSNADRFWLAINSLPAGRQSVKILDFATNEDRIGIVAPGVTRKADLNLSYDEASNTGRIGVGNRTLAELPGVDPRSLAADSFLFSTNGSIFDSSLPLASSNLKAMPT